MTDEAIEVMPGSGNVFRDFGYADADVRQAKALMGTQIMRILDQEGLSTREAEDRTGVSHSDFSRIRQAKFSRFTIDRLMVILAMASGQTLCWVFGQDGRALDIEVNGPLTFSDPARMLVPAARTAVSGGTVHHGAALTRDVSSASLCM